MKRDIKLNIGDVVIAFNGLEWNKTGDLPDGNHKYYQKAYVLGVRSSDRGEKIADVLFIKSKRRSNGHFLHTLTINDNERI